MNYLFIQKHSWRRFRALGASLAVAVLSSQSLGAQTSEWVRKASGCYELVPGPWQTDSLIASIFPVSSVSARFKLEANLLEGWPMLQNAFAVTEFPAASQSKGAFLHWSKYSGDSIYVGQPLPMGGASLVLARDLDGEDLTGRIQIFTDQLFPDRPSSASRPIRARKLDCAGWR